MATTHRRNEKIIFDGAYSRAATLDDKTLLSQLHDLRGRRRAATEYRLVLNAFYKVVNERNLTPREL